MNKIFTFLFVMLFSAVCVWAGPVDVETARQQAASFFNQQTIPQGMRRVNANKQLSLLHTQRRTSQEEPLLYVFGYEEGEGYAIIAGDDAAVEPVLGYSITSAFRADSIPCCLREWLDEYGRQLAFARESPQSIKRSPRKVSSAYIAPRINTKWNQHAPYNNLCPTTGTGGNRCVTGCVATAMAQIMYYHKWPETGSGSNSYEWKGHILSANFGGTTYEWDMMKATYSSDDDDPHDAVATLMYHCGVAVNMDYSTSFSSAGVSAQTLINYFRYDAETTKDGWDDGRLEDIMYKELAAYRPVMICGSGTGAHEFICDGYKDGYFHFNFGWGGYCDDYYLLYAIQTNNGDYSNDHFIIYGVQPQGPEGKEMTIDGIDYKIYPNHTANLIKGNVKGNFAIPASVQADGETYQVTNIADDAFAFCYDVNSLIIPEGLKTIGDRAFMYCANMTSLTIPHSITSIGEYAFEGCGSLTSLSLDCDEIDAWFSGNTSIVEITLGNNVTALNRSAFEGCSSLASVTIPSSLKTIGDRAFLGCGSLASVNLPNSITFIGKRAFYGCSSLKSVTLPTGITSIGERAFTGCSSLTSVMIRKRVTSIGDYAFGECDRLMSVVSLIEEPYAFSGKKSQYPVFSNNTFANATLYVPNGTIEKYQGTDGWKDFANIAIIDPADIAATPVQALVIKNEGNHLIIEGSTDGEQVSVHTIYGMQAGSAVSKNGRATIDTHLSKGSIAIVKVGDKRVKVLVK